ncbi:PCNA-interacting partner-like isoform X2 [Patiria miniata]|nr:PCNA-interacting partner-like isoform X2 [Patiria miniata]
MAAECSDVQGSIYHLTGYDRMQLPAILDAVKKLPCMQDLPCDGDKVFVCGRPGQCNAAMTVKSPIQVLVEFYRRLKPSGPGCKTILSSESQLVVVQLCLAEFSKQKYDIYDTDASEVFRMTRELNEHKLSQLDADSSTAECQNSPDEISLTLSHYQSVRQLYQAFLSSCNMLDVADVCRQVKSLLEKDDDVAKSFRTKTKLIVLQWPTEPLERKILELLIGQTSVTEIQVEMLESASTEDSSNGEFRLHVSKRNWETVQDFSRDQSFPVSTPKTPRSPVSSTEILVHHVFLSFLGLLVNSRDEISLARCLSYSPSGLDHKGFTALKNAAKSKNMSMYQTAVSYITRLRLGGRSYAPNSEMSALADHVKSLGEFVTNVQKLQVLVEEVPDTRESIAKVLLSIKNTLCKCRGAVFKQEAVDKVCQKLRGKCDVLLTAFDGKNGASPPKAVNQGGSVLGRRTLKVILAFLDREATIPAHHHAVNLLSDCTLTQTTPVRMPSLLAQFRSPEVDNPKSPENQALRDRLIEPKEEVKGPKMFGYKSDMAWAEPEHRNPLQERNQNIEQNVPSKTTSQRIKLWAETPPEKHHQARVFTHEFESPLASPPSRPTTGRGTVDHTPKRPKGRVANRTEAALDKENLPVTHGQGGKAKGAGISKKGAEVKRRVKRVLMEDSGSGQPSKKAKKGVAGAQKKKQMTLVKGQKTLNQFFRL